MRSVKGIIVATTLCTSLISLPTQAQSAHDSKAHITITPQEMVWVSGPDSLPPGAKMVVLEGDPSKAGPFTIRIKTPSNYKIPAHWHPEIEHVTVLKGTMYMGEGDKLDESKGHEMPVGSYAVIPKKAHHFAWTGSEEGEIQLHGVGPWGITYINAEDDPRGKKK